VFAICLRLLIRGSLVQVQQEEPQTLPVMAGFFVD